mmetsp:Transcript_27970/g.55067  ORF Transcript_27970/g.55067 Transcript_27970/m.55067 type:complete len:506 (-) Transcript_27970:221-1738(-)
MRLCHLEAWIARSEVKIRRKRWLLCRFFDTEQGWVVLHEFEGEIVRLYELELILVDLQLVAYMQVLGAVPFESGRILHAALLEELPTDETRVALELFEDGDGVVVHVVCDNETTVLIFAGRVHKLSQITQVQAIVFHQFLKVNLGDLVDQVQEGTQRILFSTKSSVRRRFHASDGRFGVLHVQLREVGFGVSEVFDVVLLCEGVTAADDQLTAVHVASAADFEVLFRVVLHALFSSPSNLCNVRGNFLEHLGELIPLEQRGEGVTAVVVLSDFENFDGVVSQEVMDDVRALFTVHLGVSPDTVEAKHLSVVLEELLSGSDIDTHLFAQASFHKLFVLVHLLVVSGGLDSMLLGEGVQGVGFSFSKINTVVFEEGSGEVVAVCQAEDTAVDAEFSGDEEIVKVDKLVVALGDAVSLDENALGDTGVLNLGLGNVHRVILQIVVDHALANAEIFERARVHSFFEEAEKAQDFPVVRNPGREAGHGGSSGLEPGVLSVVEIVRSASDL